ncbi:MAG: hypothetical protein LBE08_00230 [Bifidobacteriaceae bacterium]|jgi:hypothetical protein|nr:hypothetical protein [Bifidobacteriaceae bacterium]
MSAGFTLTDPPCGVDRGLWCAGTGDSPETGALWLLSWEREALALGVIAGFGSDFVYMWPVTLAEQFAFRPAVIAGPASFGTKLAVWPSREMPVGLHLLDRPLGRVWSAKTMALIEDAVEAGNPLPASLRYAPECVDSVDAEDADDAMIGLWNAICWNAWPPLTIGAMPLSTDALAANNLDAARVAQILGLQTREISGLFEQTQFPTAEQISALASAAGVEDPLDLLEPPSDADALEQAAPRWKRSVLRLADHLGLGEAETRDAIRAEFALAARSTAPDGLMQAAIDRLMSWAAPDDKAHQ